MCVCLISTSLFMDITTAIKKKKKAKHLPFMATGTQTPGYLCALHHYTTMNGIAHSDLNFVCIRSAMEPDFMKLLIFQADVAFRGSLELCNYRYMAELFLPLNATTSQ